MQQPPPLPAVNPYAAPAARVVDVVGNEVELADRGARLLAVIVDSLIFGIPVGMLLVAMPGLLLGTRGAAPDPTVYRSVAALLGLFAITLTIVDFVLLHRYGQTIGKRILKIRIVRSDGSRCGLLRVIFVRWLPLAIVGAIPIIGPLCSLLDPLLIFRDDYRCLHDHIADTIVVKA